LIHKGIINYTKKVFPEEITLILATTNLMRRMTSVSKDAIGEFSKDPRLPAVMNLFCRNRELVHFSTVCLMNAGYAPAKILLRVGLENALSMHLFSKRADLAKQWLSKPEQFRKKWQAGDIRKELFSDNPQLLQAHRVFYSELCDYVHPSLKGWREQIDEKGIAWRPVLNADYASECIGLTFFVMFHSVMRFDDSFRRWLSEDFVAEVNNLLMKDSQMVKRHFRLQKGKATF
jgi:hypothetical protein